MLILEQLRNKDVYQSTTTDTSLNCVVKETTFQFGIDSVRGFLHEHGIKPDHHVIIDELICTKYDKKFLNSLVALKESVKSLWIAMGAEPITGNDKNAVKKK